MKNENYEIIGHLYILERLYYCVKAGRNVSIMQNIEYERIILAEQKYMRQQESKKKRVA